MQSASTWSRVLFGIIIWISLASTGMGAAAIGSTYWMEVSVSAGSTKSWANAGLFQSCSGSKCDDITSYDDYTCPSGTVRKGLEMKIRMDTVKGTMFTGMFSSFAVGVLAVFGYRDAKRLYWWLALGFALVEVVGYVIAVVLFSHSVDYWYKCDAGMCADTAGCVFYYGYSFALAASSMGVALLTVCFIALLYRLTGGGTYAATKPIPSPPINPINGSLAIVAATSPREDKTPVGEEWSFDAASGMYWSTKRSLYLDPDTGHYFDPTTAQWYNPETGVWYAAA